MSVQTKSQRLFFALWPDNKVRKAISAVGKRAAQQHQGRLVATDNLHLTLSFLGNVSNSQRDCIGRLAESISITPFSLCLEHLGVFPRARVLWLGIKEQPNPLKQLAARLDKGARDCGIQLADQGFTPHVTLMRKVNQLHEFEVEPIHWDVNQFCLVQSVSHPQGVEYRVLKIW